MALIDELKATSPAFSTMSNLEIADYIHQKYAPTWQKEDVYARLGFTPPTNPSGILSSLPEGIESGFRTAQIGTNLLLNAAGVQGDESTANRIAELKRRQAEIAPTGATKAGMEEIQKAGESGDIGDTLYAMATNPRAMGRYLLESAGSFIPDIALAATGAGLAGIGAKALAMRLGYQALSAEAIGLASKVATQAATVGAGSAKTEYGAEFLEALQDAGVDLSSGTSIRKAFQNEELMAKAREEGLAKGIPVGLFDGISMGLAGRFYSKLAGETIKSKLVGSAAEAGMQGGLGMAGEASGQLLQKGQISNIADILLEGILEVATAGPEAALNLRHNSAYQANLEALNRATSTIARDAQGNQLALPLHRYETPGGQLSGPLVDKLIEKMAPRNSEVERIKNADIDVDTKRRMALEAIYGPSIKQTQIDADTLESSSPSGQIQTGSQRRDEIAADRVGSRVADITAADQAERLTESQSTPVNSIDEAATAKAALDKREAGIADAFKKDLEGFENTLKEMGSDAFQLPGFIADLKYARSQVAEYEAAQRDAAVEARRNASDPREYPIAEFPSEPAAPSEPQPQPSEVIPPETIPKDVWKATRDFVSQLSQEPGEPSPGSKKGTDNVINLGVLQSRISNNLGKPVPLSMIRETLDQMATPQENIAPMVTKDRSGRYYRNSGTYNIPGPIGTNTVERPTTRMSESLVGKNNLPLNPSPEPRGVSPLSWYKASWMASNMPTGKSLTPKMLAEVADIPQAQIPPIMKALISSGALSRGAVPTRTSEVVPMPNTLSDERVTKLLRDELSGKSYGC